MGQTHLLHASTKCSNLLEGPCHQAASTACDTIAVSLQPSGLHTPHMQTGPLRDITTLVPLLQLFPSLTSLSLLSRTISSCHSCAALISTLPASTLHTLYLGTACPDTSSANQCIQLIGRLTALRDLSISLDATVRPGSEKPVDQPLIHVGPLGALGQLQQLELVFDGIASVDAGSLCHIAAGCTQLQRLVIMSTHKQPVMSRSGPGSGSGSGAGASSTAAAAGVAGAAAWPSLRRLLLFATMEDLSGLFDLVFRSMPGLQYLLLSAVQIHIAPHTMTALYRKLAAAQWPNNLYLSLATPITWDQGSQGRPAREVIPARKVIPGIGQLAGRVARLNLEQLLLNEGDVAALAAALGPGLQELNFSFSWGPCGAAALEAVVGLPGLTTLLLPRAQPEPGWEDALLRACVLAQTSQQRTRPLTMQLRKDRPGFQELLDRWAGAWAALPQPQAGPMRVTLTQSQVREALRRDPVYTEPSRHRVGAEA